MAPSSQFVHVGLGFLFMSVFVFMSVFLSLLRCLARHETYSLFTITCSLNRGALSLGNLSRIARPPHVSSEDFSRFVISGDRRAVCETSS